MNDHQPATIRHDDCGLSKTDAIHGAPDRRPHVLLAAADAVRDSVSPGSLSEPDVVLEATRISLWGRWSIWLLVVFLNDYRPSF